MKGNHNHLQDVIKERTLMMVKPDGMKEKKMGDIIGRIERVGLRIVACKIVRATRRQLEGHFPASKDWICNLGHNSLSFSKEHGMDTKQIFGSDDPYEIGMKIKEWNFEYLSSGPVLLLVIEGMHAIAIIRKMIGHTLPYLAAPGTIRGDNSMSSPDVANRQKHACYNVVHASKDTTESKQEINNWFRPEEIISWE